MGGAAELASGCRWDKSRPAPPPSSSSSLVGGAIEVDHRFGVERLGFSVEIGGAFFLTEMLRPSLWLLPAPLLTGSSLGDELTKPKKRFFLSSLGVLGVDACW